MVCIAGLNLPSAPLIYRSPLTNEHRDVIGLCPTAHQPADLEYGRLAERNSSVTPRVIRPNKTLS